VQPDYVSLVHWEPWERDGHDFWRCTIHTGHGELSWVTRYGPGKNAVTLDDLRLALHLLDTEMWHDEAARLRAALDALEADDE